jgi:hypothetical protein
VGGQVVSYVPDQLPRSRAYAAGPRRRTRPRVGGLLARSVLRYVTECKELIARIVGCSCDPGGRCCGGDLVDAVAGIANDRREPAVAREISRRNPCIRLDPAGPDHEAIIRFGGKAPKRRAGSLRNWPRRPSGRPPAYHLRKSLPCGHRATALPLPPNGTGPVSTLVPGPLAGWVVNDWPP